MKGSMQGPINKITKSGARNLEAVSSFFAKTSA